MTTSPGSGLGRAGATESRGRQRRLGRVGVLRVFPAVCAAFTLGVLLYLGGGEGGDLGLVVYALVGPLALAVMVYLGHRHWPAGTPVTLVGCLVFTAATFFLLIDLLRSEDANGVLVLVVLPVYQVVFAVVVAVTAALTHWLRARA